MLFYANDSSSPFALPTQITRKEKEKKKKKEKKKERKKELRACTNTDGIST